MKFQESESVELKSIVQDDIKKEIIAFANCNGGIIYVGITDQGEIIGVESTDDSALQISNMVRDSIKPDITMFIHYETLELEGKSIIAVHIQRGTNRPYYLTKKGLRPEGVYVRQGYSSVPASDTAIRQMIKETDGDSFEEMRSLSQALSFDALRQEFKTRKIPFAQAQMQTLHMQSTDKLYTNLALLLSDQCPYSIKLAVFESGTETVFKDRREFSGSLMQQLHDVYDYIDLHNQVHARLPCRYPYPYLSGLYGVCHSWRSTHRVGACGYQVRDFRLPKSPSCQCFLSIAINRGLWNRH